MKEKETDISVVYLAWLPYGIHHFQEFIASYQQFSAGLEHTLVIAFNGLDEKTNDLPEKYKGLLREAGISNARFFYYETGQDIVIYKQVAAEIASAHILFVNTFSRFRTADWLKHYADNWADGVGLIGASGSFGNYFTGIKTTLLAQLKSKMLFTQKIRELKYFLKLFFLHRKNFSKFPSPHIRTNAFFINRKIFLGLAGTDIRNKMEAYFFENGKHSLTAQVQNAGYRCILIDKKGKAYVIKDWPFANIFWQRDQGDLLISDNQTRKYDEAVEGEKALLQKIAWGSDE